MSTSQTRREWAADLRQWADRRSDCSWVDEALMARRSAARKAADADGRVPAHIIYDTTGRSGPYALYQTFALGDALRRLEEAAERTRRLGRAKAEYYREVAADLEEYEHYYRRRRRAWASQQQRVLDALRHFARSGIYPQLVKVAVGTTAEWCTGGRESRVLAWYRAPALRVWREPEEVWHGPHGPITDPQPEACAVDVLREQVAMEVFGLQAIRQLVNERRSRVHWTVRLQMAPLIQGKAPSGRPLTGRPLWQMVDVSDDAVRQRALGIWRGLRWESASLPLDAEILA